MVSKFLQLQLDYIFFFYGLAFICLAATTWALSYSEGRQLPWKWLSLFGLMHGINEWLDMLALSLKDTQSFAVIRLIVMVISFLFLFEFGRSGSIIVGKNQIGRWIFIPLLILTGVGSIAGIPGLNSAARYALALPGSVWTCMNLWRFRQSVHPKSRSFLVVFFSMVFYGLATSVVVPEASFFAATFLNYGSFFAFTGFPIQLLRGLLICTMAAAFWQHYCSYRKEAFKTVISTKVFRYEFWTTATIVAVLIAGSFMTWSFGEYGRRQDGEHYRAELELARRMLEDSVQNVSELTKAMAASPDLIINPPGSQGDLAKINSTLDRYSRVISGSICYVLDLKGITVASSNRDTSDSFVGHSYGIRPYFKDALNGSQGSYIAVGLTSITPGYYTSYPIKNTEGKIAGVAAIKLNLDKMYTSPIGDHLGFLVTSGGIILASTHPEYFLKTLHPINKDLLRHIAESKQFPNIVDSSVLPLDAVPGTLFYLQGEILQVFLQNTSVEDLSFVLLGPMTSWKILRLVSIFITLLIAVLLISFFAIQQKNSESSARIATSEKLYRTLVDGSPNWVGLFDHEGRYISINGNGLKVMGRKESEIRGRTFAEIWSKEKEPQLEDSVRQVLKGVRLSFEIDQHLPNGSLITWYVVLNPVIQEGTVSSFVGIATDISTRKQAEKALRESEAKFRSLAESSPDYIMRYDRDCRHTYMNPAALAVSGLTEIDIIGKTHRESGFPDDLSTIWEEKIAQVFKTGKPSQTEFSWESSIGQIILDWRLTPEFDEENQVISVLGVSRDITDRKQAEERLRELEERFRLTFYTSPDAVNINTMDGTYLDINEGFTQLTGFTREDVIGKTSADISIWDIPEDRKRLVEGLQRDGNVKNIESRFLMKDGSFKIALMSAVIIHLKGEPHILSITRDITGFRKAEEDKLKLERQLQQAHKMESVGRLAGGVAHDFNNMLGVILGHTELAMEELDPSLPIFGDLQQIKRAANRSADMTRQLLAFARKQIVVPKVIDLNETVAGMLKMLLRLIGEDIDLAWLPGKGLWPIKIDPSQIDQILANLCVNARDAIAGVGKITVETGNCTLVEEYCSTHAGFVPGQYVKIEVSDNGSGIDKETVPHIFEPFFTTKGVNEGTGLGLATVYGIVKQNNGFVYVYSEQGEGTTFTIYLPRHAGTSEIHLESPAEPAIGGNETILLVEDEPTILNMTTTMLQRLGYTVLAANTPSEAIRLADGHSGKIDLLLTDVIMPEMNSRILMGKIIANRPELKCLFMSGYTANVISHHGVLDEGVCFIQKPFSKIELAAKIRETFGS